METIKQNYKPAGDIEEEVKNCDLMNYGMFDSKDDFEFDSCDYCNGPVLGHLEAKCPRLEYDPEMVRKFERYLLKNKGMIFKMELRKQQNKE